MDVVEQWVQMSYRRPMVTSSAVALLVALSAAVALRFEQRGGRVGDTAVESAVIVVCAAAFLVVKRTHPAWALAGTVGGAFVYMAYTGHFNAAITLPVAVCLCSIASRYSARIATVTALATCAVLTVGALVLGDQWLLVERLGLIGWPLLGASIGGLTRARNRYVTAVETRAQVASALHEYETERRMVEERLRLAREIHDVVAHHLAALNLQIGSARYLLDRPEHAAAALAGMHENSRGAMQEIKALVAMLRTDRDEDGNLDGPLPGFGDVPGLIETVRENGVDAALIIRGTEREILPDVGFAVYRVVQEAVTNAVKHAPGESIAVTVVFHANTVAVEVGNQIPSAGPVRHPGDSTGFGMIGMAERVRAAGGWFEAGPVDGRFVIAVELPLPIRTPQEQNQ